MPRRKALRRRQQPAQLHESHGPEAAAFEKASNAELKPDRYRDTMAFYAGVRYIIQPTRWALKRNCASAITSAAGTASKALSPVILPTANNRECSNERASLKSGRDGTLVVVSRDQPGRNPPPPSHPPAGRHGRLGQLRTQAHGIVQ